MSRYIELNPVRAHMVEDPADYHWSSYQKNAQGKEAELITPHFCYLSLGETDEERQSAYQSLFVGQIPEQKLKEIRDTLNKAWVLGSDHFKRQIEKQTGRRAQGGDRKSEKYRANV